MRFMNSPKLVLFFVLNLSAFNFVLEADETKTSTSSESKDGSASTAIAAVPGGISGKITVADRDAKVVKMVDAKNETHIFKVTSNTKITVNDQSGKVEDIGVGMDAVILPDEYAAHAKTIVAKGTPPVKPTYDFSKKKVKLNIYKK
jgi:hypothetical protein